MVQPEALAYDFNGAMPWFECPTTEFGPETVEVNAFQSKNQYFTSENLRDITAEVTCPEKQWSQIAMMVNSACPAHRLCGHWDRSASIQLMLDSPENAGFKAI